MLTIQERSRETVTAQPFNMYPLRILADYRRLKWIQKYGSPNHLSKKFYDYWNMCIRDCPVELSQNTVLDSVVEKFTKRGVTSWATSKSRDIADRIYRSLLEKERTDPTLWDNQLRLTSDLLQTFPEIENVFHDSLSEFLCRAFRTQYKIFFGVLYKSVGSDTPRTGSQLWHSDRGPGTCINVMLALSPVTEENDALCCIDNKHTLQLSKEVLRNNRKLEKTQSPGKSPHEIKTIIRKLNSHYIDRKIATEEEYTVNRPVGDSGLIIPFSNNCFHRGGHPDIGETRYVCVFHCYPSRTKPDWNAYRRIGIRKYAPYPEVP